MNINNLFDNIELNLDEEIFEDIINSGGIKLERITSNGQATAPGDWYDQSNDEWVILLKGSAGIRFDENDEVILLKPGDYLNIPAHKKHRVEFTDKFEPTIWLALHYNFQ